MAKCVIHYAAVSRGAQAGAVGSSWTMLHAMVRDWATRMTLVCLAASAALGACSGTSVGSVGAVLGRDRDTGALHVREAPAGLAAHGAGLLPGDRIKMIDGLHADELDEQQIRGLLRGEVGTTVRLTVVRGDEVLHLEIRRGKLEEPDPLPPQEQRIEP